MLLIIIAILVTVILCSFIFTNKEDDISSVKVLEFDSISELQGLNVSDVSSAENTLYKVGTDYYSYFPSTGKLELVTQVHDYSTASLDLLGDMYSKLPANDKNDDYITMTSKVETLEVFGNAIQERTEYLER